MLNGTNKHWIRYARVTLLIIVASLLCFVSFNPKVSAADLLNRSITVGTSEVDTLTSHRYQFRIQTSVTVGSLEVEYCTNSPYVGTSCTAPSGFNLDAVTMGAQSGVTGFSISPSTTTNKLILTRAAAGVSAPVNVSLTVNNVFNPSTPNQTVFVRISTFASTNATGVRGERGTVVFATTRQITVNGFVPPYLIFCVGITVSSNCSSAEGSYLDFGELSTTTTKYVTSQFAVATNDVSGYVTNVNGLTLTSGNNIIPAMESEASLPGISQFGINLKANNSPGVGAERIGSGTGVPTALYGTANKFSFVPGILASSTNSTDFNTFTVSYITNIAASQPAGVYISTLTFITTVSF